MKRYITLTPADVLFLRKLGIAAQAEEEFVARLKPEQLAKLLADLERHKQLASKAQQKWGPQ